MKPLSFEEWYEDKYIVPPYHDEVQFSDIELYAQYRAKLAWDEAAKAQRDACISQISKSNYNFIPTNGIFDAVKYVPLVEYKETL